MRRATTALLAVCLATFAAFTASAAPGDPPPPTYPLDNVTSAFQNSTRSINDPSIGRYNFEAGMYGAARRAVQRYPEHYLSAGIDVRREAQVALDSLFHVRPKLPYDHPTDAGHPGLMPDWDHDGMFGDSGGVDVNGRGDFDADTDEHEDTAYFRVPCYTPDDEWQIHHRYASGACDVAGAAAQPYRVGVARELKVINAHGLVLDATLWIPASAFAGTACPAFGGATYGQTEAWDGCVSPANLNHDGAFPGLVFANGFASRQEHYSWFVMRMVDEGYVVLAYDPAGQGESEGTGNDTIGFTDSQRADPNIAGAARDIQDMVRWFVGSPITSVEDNGPRLVPRADPASNRANPAAGPLDEAHVAIAGNSMGAGATLAYLNLLGSDGGLGSDGRPLPRIAAAVVMSGAQTTHAPVPVQFQTSDGDGSPTLTGPKLLDVTFDVRGFGIGYRPMKQMYDRLRATDDPAPMSFIVMEGGTHTDHASVPYVPRTLWANALAADYGADHINCYVRGIATACASAIAMRPHLSRIYASEYDPDGPIGPSVSRCISVPDAWSLHESPQEILDAASGSPRYDCTP